MRILPTDMASRMKWVRQFVIFGLVGATGMGVALGTLNLCMMMWESFLFANVIAFFVAGTWNFFLNRRWTFDATGKPIVRQWGEFLTACLSGTAVNWTASMGLYYSFPFFAAHYNAAAIIGVIVGYVANFILSRNYVFRRANAPVSDSSELTRSATVSDE